MADLKLSRHELNILKKLNARKNGTYFCICFETDLNRYLRAGAKGYNVKKLTITSARKGIDRRSMAGYQEKEATRAPWYHHIDKMLVKHNTQDKYYVQLFPNKGKPEVRYQVNGRDVSKEELKEMDILIPSYFNKTIDDMYMIELKNILDVYNRK